MLRPNSIAMAQRAQDDEAPEGIGATEARRLCGEPTPEGIERVLDKGQ